MDDDGQNPAWISGVHQIVAMTPQRQTLTPTRRRRGQCLTSPTCRHLRPADLTDDLTDHRHAIPSAWMQTEVKRHGIQGREAKRHAWMFIPLGPVGGVVVARNQS